MRRFLVETLWVAAFCLVLFLAYFLTGRLFGDAGKWVFVAVAAVAVAAYLALRRRRRD